MSQKKLKIAFVVNTTGMTGGIRVIFEHAKRLRNSGHEVYVIHLLRLNDDLRGNLIGALKKIKYTFANQKIKWFDTSGIKILRLISLDNAPKVDVMIATANETADWVAKNKQNCEKLYFIQGYEDWTRTKELVDATYRLPLKKIVIASWLKKLLKEKFSQKVYGTVVNGVDFEKFDCKEKKWNENAKILMMYHPLPLKGFKLGLEAFGKAKKTFPKIELVVFGAYQPEAGLLPANTNFYFNPAPEQLSALYAESDIFISPSLQEGCQLPPMEAMASQCAVIATNIGGIPDYAVDGKTVLAIPPGDSEAIYDALSKLLSDKEKMHSIAKEGYDYIQNFTWEKANKQLEKIIIEAINERN